jgi:hypothetical protein
MVIQDRGGQMEHKKFLYTAEEGISAELPCSKKTAPDFLAAKLFVRCP